MRLLKSPGWLKDRRLFGCSIWVESKALTRTTDTHDMDTESEATESILTLDDSSESVNVECSPPPAGTRSRKQFTGTKKGTCGAFWPVSAILALFVLAAFCLVLTYWLRQTQCPFQMQSTTAGIDAAGLAGCVGSDAMHWRVPCLRRLNGNGSLVMVAGLGTPIAPLSLSGEPRPKETSASAAPAPAADGSPSSLSIDGSGLRIHRAGLYQVNAQVTFRDPSFADNAAAFVSANGRVFAQCHRYCGGSGDGGGGGAVAAPSMPCPLTVVRRFATGDLVTLSAEGYVQVAVEPSLTFLAISALPLPVKCHEG